MKYLSLLLALIPLAIQPNRRAAVPPHSNMIEVVLPGPAMATLLDAVFGGRGQIFVAGPRPAEVNAKEKEAKAKQYTRAPFELMNPGYKGKALEIWKARIQEEYDQYLPAHSQLGLQYAYFHFPTWRHAQRQIQTAQMSKPVNPPSLVEPQLPSASAQEQARKASNASYQDACFHSYKRQASAKK